MAWSAETVEGLAPDPASVAAARKLARSGPWSSVGYDERAVWGLCKGSGARPYQASVDLAGPAFKCSCPSRKFPCKHALALLLLWAGG
ncbi:MAG TPA: SWIM zinc finger family protein, partial [Solirubrobacter sp.]